MNNTTFEDLPDEIIYYIFEYVLSEDEEPLTTPQTFMVPLNFVSRRWLCVMNEIKKKYTFKTTAYEIFIYEDWNMLKWYFECWYKETNFVMLVEKLSCNYNICPMKVIEHAFGVDKRFSHLNTSGLAVFITTTEIIKKKLIEEIEKETFLCEYCDTWNHSYANCDVYKDRKCILCEDKGHPHWDCPFLSNFLCKSKVGRTPEANNWAYRSLCRDMRKQSPVVEFKSVLSHPKILKEMEKFKLVRCWICNKKGHNARFCEDIKAQDVFFADKDIKKAMYLYSEKKWGQSQALKKYRVRHKKIFK